jgi:hypothetical protein
MLVNPTQSSVVLVVSVSASWEFFVVDLRPNPALWKPPTPFFYSGIVVRCPFSYFRFFGGADAPTTLTDRDHPLPPIEKSPSYPQASVDSVDNFCKLLIPLDIL